jgi:hypothetical protein
MLTRFRLEKLFDMSVTQVWFQCLTSSKTIPLAKSLYLTSRPRLLGSLPPFFAVAPWLCEK